MFLLLPFILLLSNSASSNQKIGSPNFHWVSTFKSDQGFSLLNIKYPDHREDDFALLKKIKSKNVCLLEGFLKVEPNVTVKMTKKCNSENNFQIEFNSKRLFYSSFNVSHGKTIPILPKREKSTSSSKTKKNYPHSLPVNGFVLKLVAFYDVSFKAKFGSASKAIVQTVLDEAQKLFSLPSLTVDIKLEVVDVKEINETIASANQDLTNFLENNSSNAFLFLTGKHLTREVKTTRAGSICSSDLKERSAIVPWRISRVETSKDLVQELGYLLGIGNDYQLNPDHTKILNRFDIKRKPCTNINGIMDYSSEHVVWSTCSVEDFIDYYNTVRSKKAGANFCLNEQPGEPSGYSKVLVALGGISTDVEIIDLMSSKTTCENLRSFPERLRDAAGGLDFQGKPLICGGWRNVKTCYNLQEDGNWGYSHSLREGRYKFSVTTSPFKDGSSKLFISGGHNSIPLDSTEVLTASGWQDSVPMPVRLYGHCMVPFNSTSVMAIGGIKGIQTTDKSFIFNSETNKWTEGPTLNQGRNYHSCGRIRTNEETETMSIIVVGGIIASQLKSVEILDPQSNGWRQGPDLPIGIEKAALVEDPSGGAVLIGGFSSGNIELDTLYRLPHGGPNASWVKMQQKLRKPNSDFAAFLVPNEITACN